MAFGGLLEGVGLAFLVPLVALLTGQQGGWLHDLTQRGFAAIGAETRMARLAALLAIFVAVLVLRAIVLTLRDRQLARLQTDFVTHLRLRLIAVLGGARWQDIAGLRHARITHALGTEIGRIAGAAQLTLQGAAVAVTLAAQWLLTLALAPALAGLAIVLLAANALALLPSLRRSAVLGHATSQASLSITNTATQLLGGLKLAIAQNMQDAFTAEFAAAAHEQAERQIEYQRRQTRFRVAVSTGSAFAGAALLLFGLWLDMPVATLLAALVVLMRMAGPALALQQSVLQLANMLPSYAGFAGLVAELERQGGTTRVQQSGSVPSGRIEFDCVDYGYAGTPGAGVRELSVIIDPGEIVGIAGPSGAGKTTFVDLLAGLLTPEAGAIRVAGVLLDEANAGRWRASIAYVAQEPYLLNDTIRRNLVWGIDAPDDADIREALELAGASGLVRRLPDGLDTIVSERGMRLSGGERQRIALARALIRKPALLILDEATNAIDIAAEQAILTALAESEARPTMVIVAHRPETQRICGRVLRFEDGRLVEGQSGC